MPVQTGTGRPFGSSHPDRFSYIASPRPKKDDEDGGLKGKELNKFTDAGLMTNFNDK